MEFIIKKETLTGILMQKETMNYSFFKPLSFTTLLVAILFSSPINAQYGGFTEILPKGLTVEDIEFMKETARGKMENEPIDTILRWKNPASGNSGAVKLLRRFQLLERECMTNRHFFLFKNGEKRVVDATVCREESGPWIFRN